MKNLIGLFVLLWTLANSIGAHAAEEWIYTVRQGDTLTHIAERHLDNSQAWRTLQKINKVADPNQLKPGSQLRIPYALSGGATLFAETVWVRGEVTLHTGGSAATLKQGDQLRIGDKVTTASEAGATLRFADQSRMMIAANSTVTLTHMLKDKSNGQVATTVMLDAGSVESIVQRGQKVDARFEVKTPTLNLAVRGTRFRVVVDSATGMTSSEVTEGEIIASAQGREVRVSAGQGTFAAKGAAPAAARELMPSPVLMEAAEVVDTLPIRFAWKASADVRQYRIELLDPTGERQVDELRSIDAQARWASLADGEYQLRVRAMDASGLEGQPAIHAFKLKGQPAPPILRHPVAETVIEGEKVAFRWARTVGIQNFRIQVSDTPDFSRIVSQIKQLPGSVSGVDLALAPGKYFWRMTSATKENGWGPESVAESFELRAGTGVMLPAPEQIDLSWKPVRPGQKVQVQVAASPDFKVTLFDSTQTDNRARIAAPGKGPFYVRMRRIEADGLATLFDPIQQITVAENR